MSSKRQECPVRLSGFKLCPREQFGTGRTEETALAIWDPKVWRQLLANCHDLNPCQECWETQLDSANAYICLHHPISTLKTQNDIELRNP